MRVTIGRTGLLPAGAGPRNDGGDQRRGIDQTEPLMELQHMRALVEPGLILGISLGLCRGKAEVPQRKQSTQRQIQRLLGRYADGHFRYVADEAFG